MGSGDCHVQHTRSTQVERLPNLWDVGNHRIGESAFQLLAREPPVPAEEGGVFEILRIQTAHHLREHQIHGSGTIQPEMSG